MLATLPLLVFLLVILITLLRGRAVRARSGTSAWAFTNARGIQRLSGVVFAVSCCTLVLLSALLASGSLTVPADRLTFGTAGIALGALIVAIAQLQMGNAWRVGVRDGDAPLFVRAGLFRVSRNPIFVGMILMALGTSVAAGTPWGWAGTLTFIAACHIQTRVEEIHLSRQFGDAYDAYRRAVPRWLLL